MIQVPYQELSHEILDALIESFLLREGTDYGLHECSLEEKLLQVKAQIKSGKVIITYDPQSESCNLVSADFKGI